MWNGECRAGLALFVPRFAVGKEGDGAHFAQITPGNPEQLFAVAYSDYSRGNDALALSEFQQYVETYPDSELADNAEYWIGWRF